MNENLLDEAAVTAALMFKDEIKSFSELEQISHKVRDALKKHFEDRENESNQSS